MKIHFQNLVNIRIHLILVSKYMKRIIFLIAMLFAFGVGAVFAQESPEEAAKKYNIQFPIVELGNCTDVSSCKTYCDNEVNRDTCINFARKKGFHKEIKRPDDAILQSAKSTLGCDSETTCRSICEKEENFEKCSSFGQKHGLGGGQRGKPGGEVLQKAKEILGCDSEASCKSICENPDNQQKCSDFAQKTGLGGGIRKVGPGGCNSEESCRSYCETNKEECMKFGGNRSEGSDSQRRGPGGCDSEESCMEYCKSNPAECEKMGGMRPQEGRDGPPKMSPEDMKRQYDRFRERPSGTKEFYPDRAGDMKYQQPPEQYNNERYVPSGEEKIMTNPTPGTSYLYPTPIYATPTYTYPTPSSSYIYPSPTYGTPTYPTPTYTTPTYGTPSESYTTPVYTTPNFIQGTSALDLGQWIRNFLQRITSR